MKKKHLWIIGLLTVILFLSVPAFRILKTKWNENDIHPETPKGYANDASQLNCSTKSFTNITNKNTSISNLVPTKNRTITVTAKS